MRGRAWARLQHRRPAPSERGFTLVEMLITVWILGAVMVALMGALFTMVRTSSLEQQRALGETEVRHLAELVLAEPYIPCESTGYPQTVNGFTSYSAATSAQYTPATGVTTWLVSVAGPLFGAKTGYWDKNQDASNALSGSPADNSLTFTSIANVDTNTTNANTAAVAAGKPAPYPGPPCTAGQSWDYGAQQVSVAVIVGGVLYLQTVTKYNSAASMNVGY